ncbi:LacI family transcriptional regulator [Pseudomonas synxantha]|nr:LacI family transcriptional regulator [Pseudomonas synxantha]
MWHQNIEAIRRAFFEPALQLIGDLHRRADQAVMTASAGNASAQLRQCQLFALGQFAPQLLAAALVLTSRFHSPGIEKMIAEVDIPVVETWDYVPERRDGFTATLSELGVQPWVFVPDADRAPFEAGKQAMEALMGAVTRPDAIFFANDNLAAGGLLAGQRAGLNIPQDCAVLGFGDYPFAQMLLPSLSTIQPPALQIGVLAATRVLQSLGVLPIEGEVARLNLLHCQLIEREST